MPPFSTFACSYDIMLECWQEHPLDRPTFSQLREKFSTLLLAQTGDAYMELEVDNDKLYYTVADEEENKAKERRDSTSSEDSDSSIKKPKSKKIEKPQWAANNNPYVPTPSTFKDDLVHVDDEHYRVRVDIEEQKIPDDDDVGNGVVADTEAPPSHAHLSSSTSYPPSQLSAAPILLEDQMGIPLSFLPGEKPSQPPSHQPVKKTTTNPYVDDPATKQLLADESETGNGGVSKIGSLTAELRSRMENVTAL